MKKYKYIYQSLLLLISLTVFQSCSDNSVQNVEEGELIYSHDGIIEEVGGDCSAVQVRTRSFGEFDLSDFSKIRFELNGSSDADLSSLSLFYYENDEIIYLVNLTNRDEINSTRNIEINSPRSSREIFSRVTLKSSVCTGQVFFLSFRDLKIFAYRQ
ncbi:MAG TPA: hypothetical protein PLX80_11000 [Ignavibacteria bacterium]|nr:hypothetical protein [Ignavibacteria bacterium]